MLNKSLKLNPKIFDADIEKISMRKGFGDGLIIAGQLSDKVVALCADLAESVGMEEFRKKFPSRYIEVGVAEQNLVSIASGMSAMGKIPFASSYAIFSPGRNWEQIRTTICYNNQPVKIVSTHAGLNVGPDGGSHQMLEDIAMMRALPNMTVISPCDYFETKKAILATLKMKTPVYIRLPREKSPLITSEMTPFEIGKAYTLFVPSKANADVAIIATGPIIHNALLAANELEKHGIAVKVINITTIKPLDEKTLLEISHETKAVVSVEEHQIAGGLGSVLSEFFVKHNPIPMEFVGVHDRFGQSGTATELIEYYGLGVKNIIQAVKRVHARKR